MAPVYDRASKKKPIKQGRSTESIKHAFEVAKAKKMTGKMAK